MSVTINWMFKRQMEEFFDKEFPGHRKQLNHGHRFRWIHVQAIKELPASIHYELIDNHVRLHIENLGETFKANVFSCLAKCGLSDTVFNATGSGIFIKEEPTTNEQVMNQFMLMKSTITPLINKLVDGIQDIPIKCQTLPIGSTEDLRQLEEKFAVNPNQLNPMSSGVSCSSQLKISPAAVTLETLTLTQLLKKILIIPAYQRGYAWRKRHITDILDSIRMKVEKNVSCTPLHLGTIVLKCNHEQQCEIVDGQQRLITLNVILYLLQNLTKETTNLFNINFEGSANEASQGIKHILWAKTSISNWVTLRLKSESEKTDFLNVINDIQFSTVIIPENESLDLAFSFFNSINATGKKLSDYDLLKTHHLRYVRNEHKTEQVATQWNQIEKPEFTLLFSKVLYRLRKWNDNVTPSCSPENVNNDLFRHFSAQKQCCTDMSVLDQAVTFSSLLRGGESFFAYTELYRRQLAVFKDFEAVHLLNKHLSGHSNNVLRDACFSLLFLYFIRFGENFLFEALFCISERVSELRNLYQVRQSYIDKPVLKMCTQALVRCVASDQFFNWALDPDKMYVRDKQGNTKEAYWKALDAFYKDIYQHGVFGVKYQLEQRLPK